MLFEHPSISPDRSHHLALANKAALSAPAALGRLIAGSGIDPLEFSRRFKATCPSDEANALVTHFKAWLTVHAPDHPVVVLQIMHVDDALRAAGIDPTGSFSTEVAAYDHEGNEHCPDDQKRWFAWVERSGAVHKCDWWDDENDLLEDICEATDAKAPILVLERLS
ncbi:MAG: hypothetical protein H6872_05500 [Methylobacteriaceae bacterium]|nr:hypothetical protein [Methylobacteriaceae bacterium]